MKRTLLLILIGIALFGCNNDERTSNSEEVKLSKTNIESKDNTRFKSILDYQYINDTLSIKITDIKVFDKGNSNYEIEIAMETPNVEKYAKNHKFFIHCYYYEGMEVGSNSFMPIGTNKVNKSNNEIKYKRKFKSDKDLFRVMRYGLLNTNTKQRYFTLKIDSVDFYK